MRSRKDDIRDTHNEMGFIFQMVEPANLGRWKLGAKMTVLNQLLLWLFGAASLISYRQDGLGLLRLGCAALNIIDMVVRFTGSNEG